MKALFTRDSSLFGLLAGVALMLLAGVAEAQGIPAFNAVNEGSQGKIGRAHV